MSISSPIGRSAKGEHVVTRNRRATFDYEIEGKYEAGLVLQGSEVKSLRAGKVEIVDAYGAIERGEAWLVQLYIAPFEQATVFAHEPRRRRKLLLSKHEIEELDAALRQRGYTLVPLRIYFKNGRAKVELGLGRGRTRGDKRQEIARKDADREAREAIGRARKGG